MNYVCGVSSAFGKMMELTSRHQHSALISSRDVLKIVNGKSVINYNPLEHNTDLYEVNKRTNIVAYDRPVQSAFNTLALSKLHMLQFIAYLRTCLDRNKYVCCFSDTDSCYIALAENSIDKCVREDMHEYYELTKKDWFVTDDISKREPGKW